MVIQASFAFIRHGFSCGNAASVLSKNDLINTDNLIKMVDPTLTTIGVEASKNNGKIIGDTLNKIGMVTNGMLVGCSPLIRSMETAYFMTRKWEFPPEKIYVFPLLREIDEHSNDKYSYASRLNIDNIPSYAMKSLDEQKRYLNTLGILDYFDFTFVENNEQLRREPGDIKKFIRWFTGIIEPEPDINLNVYIITHSGVLYDYSNEGFVNNSGFVINTKNGTPINYFSLTNILPKEFFKDYRNTQYLIKPLFCNGRCGNLCNVMY